MDFNKPNNQVETYTVKLLTTKDTLSIQNIWRECFTQDLAYINNFIKHCFPYSTSWGIFPIGAKNAVAMLSLLPSYANIEKPPKNSMNLRGAYVYGVGTLKDYRGKGYSHILMNAAHRYSKERSLDYILVKPAEESLFNLYQKQSFDKTLWNYLLEIDLAITRKNISGAKNNQARANNNQALVNNDQARASSELSRSISGTQNSNSVISQADLTNKKVSNFRNVQNRLEIRESLSTASFLWPKEILDYSLMEIESRDGVSKLIGNSLYYSAYPLESNAQLIKVVDHNIKTIQDLDSLATNISWEFPLATKATLELSVPTQETLLLNTSLTEEYSLSKSEISKNALIKIANPSLEVEKMLLEMHLSLSME